MAKFTINHNEDYSVIANTIFKDNRLSWKAKGLLANMLSLPDNWDYSLAGLVTLATDGLSGTRTGLKELEQYGYLERKPIREKGKIIDWEYIIYETPNHDEPLCEKPQVAKPQVEKPQVENRTQYNTNQLSTKELSTKECIYIIDYLNGKAGTNFRHIESNYNLIRPRLKDYSVEDIKKVIDKKTKERLGTDMQQYLNLTTLLRPSNFDKYLNGLDAQQPKQSVKQDYNINREFKKEELDTMFTSVDDLDKLEI